MGQHNHCVLLQCGNYWTRTVLATNTAVYETNFFQIRYGAPNPDELDIRNLIMDFFFPRFKGRSMAARRKADELRAEWRLIVNSFPTMSTSGEPVLIHWCQPVVCGCASEDHTRGRFHKLLLQVNYRHRPPRPQLKEWTKVRDCLRFHNLGHLTGGAIGGIMPLIFTIATSIFFLK